MDNVTMASESIPILPEDWTSYASFFCVVINSSWYSLSLKNWSLNAEYVTPSSVNDNEESYTSNLSCWFFLRRRGGLTLDNVPALVLDIVT